ncbi:MAG: ArsR/SmtB family transcription factor [Chthoniobacterales bacterium]
MEDTLSLTFAALADPTRRAMLARLVQGAASISDLGRPFLKKMSLPAITKHVKVLEKAGLVTKTRDAQWRPCTLNPEALRNVDDWMEQYRVLWEEQLDRLDEYLKTVISKQKQTLKGKKR